MRGKDSFLLCFLFLAFAQGLSWITASWPGPCLIQEENRNEAYNEADQKNCPTFFAGMLIVANGTVDLIKRDDNDKAIVAAFTIVLAISTIGLWIATIRLWKADERQLDHLIESSERQLRAYVFPVEAVLRKFMAEHPVECKIVIKNSGQTPAYRLTHAAMIGLVNFPPKGPFLECDASMAKSRTNLGPGAPIDKFGKRDAPLTETEANMLKAGTAALYLFGRIDFIDAFGSERWVKYRYMTGGNVGFDSEGRLAVCEEGNETSEDREIALETGHDRSPVP